MNHRITMLFVTLIVAASACTSARKVGYLNGIADASYASTKGAEETPIHSNDILSIYISSLDEEASKIFNSNRASQGMSTTSTGTNTQTGGYLVNGEGFIQLPVLGNVQAAGITKDQLKKNITNTLVSKKLLVEPLVEIRFLNYEVTVLGEVAKPTVITVPNEKISLVKALGIAGDMTIYGKRDNVLLIREEDGKRIIRHIDLNSKNFITSPYYYLQPNDVIYVEPNRAKVASAGRTQQLLPIVLTGLSAAIIVLDRVIK